VFAVFGYWNVYVRLTGLMMFDIVQASCYHYTETWRALLEMIHSLFVVITCTSTINTCRVHQSPSAVIIEHRWWSTSEALQYSQAKIICSLVTKSFVSLIWLFVTQPETVDISWPSAALLSVGQWWVQSVSSCQAPLNYDTTWQWHSVIISLLVFL